MATLEIKTADELIDQDLEARWTTRRAARQTDVFQWILRTFLDRGDPIGLAYVFYGDPNLTLDL